MEGSMDKTNKMLAFLHPILEEADPELEDFLIRYVLYWTTFTFLASAFFSLFVVIEPWLNVLSFRNWSMYNTCPYMIPWSYFDWIFENFI